MRNATWLVCVPGYTSKLFAIPRAAVVALDVFDLRGHRVCRIHREEAASGPHLVTWDGRDARGRPVPSGQYFARLQVNGPELREAQVRRLTVVR